MKHYLPARALLKYASLPLLEAANADPFGFINRIDRIVNTAITYCLLALLADGSMSQAQTLIE